MYGEWVQLVVALLNQIPEQHQQVVGQVWVELDLVNRGRWRAIVWANHITRKSDEWVIQIEVSMIEGQAIDENQSANQIVDQSTNQTEDQSTNQLTHRFDEILSFHQEQR